MSSGDNTNDKPWLGVRGIAQGNEESEAEKNKNLPFEAITTDAPLGRELPLVFDGRLTEYFSIWIVCQLLTVLTLGLYGPWARLRKQRYIAQHWSVDGKRFDVQFDPVAKFKGRLLIYALLLIGGVLMFIYPWTRPAFILGAFVLAPWLLTQSVRFNWQSLNLEDYLFSIRTKSKVIRKPLIHVGVATALTSLYWLVAARYGSSALTTMGVFVNLGFVLWLFTWLYPRATSYMVYQKFAHAKLGRMGFHLMVKPEGITKFYRKAGYSKWLLAVTVALTVFYLLSVFMVEDKGLSSFFQSLYFVVISVCGVSYTRNRRINFVMHRLQIGGLTFRSTLDAGQQAARTTGYALLALFTLGLSLAWSTIHFNRWRAQHFKVYLDGDWSIFQAGAAANASGALTDELAQAFEIDLGL